MINPWKVWPVSCDWACHLARGSAGGTDYAIPSGTPILAAFAGTLRNRVTVPTRTNPSLFTAILTRADGLAFYHLHLSAFADPGPVAAGATIGWTGGRRGAPGAGTSTGEHLHVNAYTAAGAIKDVHDYFTVQLRPASSTATPIPTQLPQLKGNNMIIVHVQAGPAYLMGNGRNVALSDALIAGQQITGLASLDVLRRRLADPYGLVKVNAQEAEIARYWIAKLI